MALPSLPDLEEGWLAYDIVDVFTAEPFCGNALAVVHGAAGLSTEQLQRVAREFNLSETAFPMPASATLVADGATYALRIFTPMTELPYAGHPSVGTAWVLAERDLLGSAEVVQACHAGLMPLQREPSGVVRLQGGTPSWGEPVDPAAGLAAVGLTATASDPRASVRVCGVGLGYLVLPVSAGALAQCVPVVKALAAFAHPVSEATGVYVVAWDPATATARTRMFAGDLGIPEDPATGSGAGSLAVWLAVNDLVPEGDTAFTVVQGVEMGRPSRMECTVTVRDGKPVRTTVGGPVVHVATGCIRVPSPRHP
jgi:trans-2,3-dihydro-3-hydroxyanthranilate isomerase